MAKIHYARVDEFWRKEQKYVYLLEKQQLSDVAWQTLQPNNMQTWLTEGIEQDFETFLPMGIRENKGHNANVIFNLFSLGVGTNRDEWAYAFTPADLEMKVQRLIKNYNLEVSRYSLAKPKTDVESFINTDPSFIKWTDRLKESLTQGKAILFKQEQIRDAIYRPFVKSFLYFDHLLNQRRYQAHFFFPNSNSDNSLICVGGYGRKPFSVFLAKSIPDLNFYADPAQCFPFYTYAEDGTNRQENITDWALEQFRSHYNDPTITKWNIFHYVYAILHHPLYRERYAANLKRELPRIPFAPDFHGSAEAGARLAELHVNYEQQPEYPLEKIEAPNEALDWRVEKMKLSKDKTRIVYNKFLTLEGIPPEAFEYRLGNRSALEWVIDQYQVSTDKRSGITNDPNREDDPEYIVRLIGQVITVSLETMKIVKSLPDLGIDQTA